MILDFFKHWIKIYFFWLTAIVENASDDILYE